MAFVGKFFVTPHAVRRYIERIQPDLGYEAALGEVIKLVEEARYIRPYANPGLPPGQLWRGPPVGPRSANDRRSRLRFVVVPNERPGYLPAIVTVLPTRPLHVAQ